jgi:hypothetical protein
MRIIQGKCGLVIVMVDVGGSVAGSSKKRYWSCPRLEVGRRDPPRDEVKRVSEEGISTKSHLIAGPRADENSRRACNCSGVLPIPSEMLRLAGDARIGAPPTILLPTEPARGLDLGGKDPGWP